MRGDSAHKGEVSNAIHIDKIMEIEITSLLETDMFPFSHSRAEGGDNAGPETWNAALNGPRPLLTTPEQFKAFRAHMKDTGFSESDEMETWPENETQALFLQLIAGDVREAPATLEGVVFDDNEESEVPEYTGWYFTTEKSRADNEEWGPFTSRYEAYKAASEELHGRRIHSAAYASTLDQIDWPAYEAASEAGRISGHMYRAEDGKIYFSLDS